MEKEVGQRAGGWVQRGAQEACFSTQTYDIPDMGVSALLKAVAWGKRQPTTACFCCVLVSISSQNRFSAMTLFFPSYSAGRQIGEIKLGLKIAIHVTFIHVISNCTVIQGQPARVIRRFTEIAML